MPPISDFTPKQTETPHKEENAKYSPTAAQNRTADILKEYQRREMAAEQAQHAIIKGLRGGDSLQTLFLKACQAISETAGSSVFYDTVKADLLAIHGTALEDPQALELDRIETQARLDKLRAATADGAELERINRAIAAHEAKLARISSRLPAPH